MKDKVFEKRLGIFFKILFLVILILAGRLWYLQIFQVNRYVQMAEGNRMRRIRLTPTRGEILDRNGDVLIRSRPAYTVSLIPDALYNKSSSSEELEVLGEILGLTNEELQELMKKGQTYPYEPVRLIEDVDPSVVVAIEENRARLPGVFIEEGWIREYLYSDLASHLVGYLGIINEHELREYGSSYNSSDLVGKSGIELLYEDYLRGKLGSVTVEVNALSRPIKTIGSLEPIPGYNIEMSIDKDLQQFVQQTFIEHTASLKEREINAASGAVVVLNPKTGEILAMVSVPGYEPGRLLDPSERSSYYAQLITDPSLPFFNRALQGQYGPGSVFKPFIAVAMLEEEVVEPDELFNATGVSQYGVRDWVITQRLAPFGLINLTDAMAVSSNHYFAEFGVKVGIDRLSKWLREFGFGAPTGLVAAPQEAIGLVPDREWKRQRFSNAPVYEQVWYPTDTEQISIGQGFITVTPLQLAVGYSAIANRGTIYQPTIIKRILSPEGNVIQEHTPVITRKLDVSSETWDAVIKGMEAVITHPRGTARNVFNDFPISVAGKTGSYEIPGKDAHGLFGAFAPIDDPEIVVVVVVEHGYGGSTSAAPIARKILDYYFGLDQIEGLTD